MKRPDGTTGAVGFLAIAGNDERRATVALDDPGGGDADDAAMPTVTVDHHAEGIPQRRIFLDAGGDGFEDAAFFLLTIGVQPVQTAGELAGTDGVLHAE